jgi:chromosome segregation ATPase
MYRAQLESQTKETADANGVLQDTVKELELIAHEKRQLMSQWKSALNGLSRRDEALSQIQDTLKVAEMAVHDYDMEIDGLRRRIQQEQGRNETLVAARDRVENDLKFVEESLSKMRVERDQLNERYTLLTKSLAQTDSETKKLVLAGKVLNSDAESLFAALQTVTAERQKLENEIIIAKSNHANINKAVENLLREQGKLQKRIHEKENEAVDVENEIAEAKVQSLNQSSLNDQVKEQLNQISVDLKSKESLVEKYQIEIRQRNDDIEKKMYRVDRLNKKYNKMIESAGGEENLGPMENTIKMLNKEIENTVNECKELERDWLRRQTELVTIAAEEQKLSDENAENQARVTVLLRQQLRYTKSLATLKAELKAAQANNVDLQKDVARINSLISANTNEETSLKNDNFALEIECMEELKALERESVSIQSSIVQAKSDKESMMEQIVDMERQALLWEKKIQLDKQTKEALDPTVGQQETQDMEREVHRMGLRLEALKRECERLSIEMERAVNKRSTIELRFKGKDSGSKSRSMTSLSSTSSSAKASDKASMELTQAGIKKKITSLKKDARALSDETTKYLGVIDERKNQLSQIAAELEELNNACAESERSNIDMQRQINDMLYQKQRNQERISYAQTYLKKLREYLNGTSEALNGLQAERRLLTANQALENVRDIIRDMQRLHPHLDDILERVFNMSDPGSDLVQL